MVDEGRLRATIDAASERFAEGYVLVAMPTVIVPKVSEYLAQGGVEFDLVDDGEDDGVPGFVLMLSSKVMAPSNRVLRNNYRWSMGLFVWWALTLTYFIITGSPEMAGGAFVLMVLFAAQAIILHGRWDRARQLHDELVRRGL